MHSTLLELVVLAVHDSGLRAQTMTLSATSVQYLALSVHPSSFIGLGALRDMCMTGRDSFLFPQDHPLSDLYIMYVCGRGLSVRCPGQLYFESFVSILPPYISATASSQDYHFIEGQI